jgi:uncharacterized RDD family membrane protein YckC
VTTSAEAIYEHTAGFWLHLGALIIDEIVLGVVGLIVSILAHSPLLANAVFWPLAALYFTVSEGSTGQTLGKPVARIRVVDDVTGDRIGYGRALLRFAVSWVSFFALLFGYLAMFADAAGQTWHDRAAHTLIIPA